MNVLVVKTQRNISLVYQCWFSGAVMETAGPCFHCFFLKLKLAIVYMTSAYEKNFFNDNSISRAGIVI